MLAFAVDEVAKLLQLPSNRPTKLLGDVKSRVMKLNFFELAKFEPKKSELECVCAAVNLRI